MKRKHILLSLLLLCTATTQAATQADQHAVFLEPRKQVITQYLRDLQNGDANDIVKLFETDGYVISTARGRKPAKEFFYAFLPQIDHAQTLLKQTFVSEDGHRLAARFHFSLKLKEGEISDGEYIDEFVFSRNSTKLKAVYMFENMHFE